MRLGRPVPAIATCALILVPVCVLAGPAPPVDAPQEYVVGFWAPIPEEVAAGASFHDGVVVRTDEALAFATVRTDTPGLFETRTSQDDRVRYVEWDDPFALRALFVPNDPRYNDVGHYGSKKVRAETAWDLTLGSTAVKVAVIDSGLLKTHEEFAGSGRVLQGWDYVNADNDPDDTCGHGTHVSGTIAATINNGKGIAGLAQVTLIPYKGLEDRIIDCSGAASGLASALRAAADAGAALSSNSWGGAGSAALTDAIAYSYNKGTAVVAAAGNDGPCSDCVGEPWRANAAKVIVVAATTSADAQAGFSSEGPEVDVAAPGASILSSTASSNTAYATFSGTSMAAPHVTGALALVKTREPALGPAALESRIRSTAVDLGAAGPDADFGHGRIDAAAALAGDGPALNQPPVAAFFYVPDGLAVHFDATASSDADGSIVSYLWSWGDGGPTGAGAVADHTYASSGTYMVTLTVTDDDAAIASLGRSVGAFRPLSVAVTVDREEYGLADEVHAVATVTDAATGDAIAGVPVEFVTRLTNGDALEPNVQSIEWLLLTGPVAAALLSVDAVDHRAVVETGPDGIARWSVPDEGRPIGQHVNAPTPAHRMELVARVSTEGRVVQEGTFYRVAAAP